MSMQHQAWLHPRRRMFRVKAIILRMRPDLLRKPRTRHNGRQAFGADILWAATLAAMSERAPGDRTPFQHAT